MRLPGRVRSGCRRKPESRNAIMTPRPESAGSAFRRSAAGSTPKRLGAWPWECSSTLAATRLLRENEAIQAQRFAHRPGLERAAARGMGRIAVGDLADVAQTRFVHMREERREKPLPRLLPRRRRAGAHPHPGLHEWTGQPRPHCPLMVDAVALRHAA